MGTSFETVIDSAVITIRDYKLDKLFKEDEESFIEVMTAYLVRAIPKFAPSCNKSLDYNIGTKEFVEDLDIHTVSQNVYEKLVEIYEKLRASAVESGVDTGSIHRPHHIAYVVGVSQEIHIREVDDPLCHFFRSDAAGDHDLAAGSLYSVVVTLSIGRSELHHPQ